MINENKILTKIILGLGNTSFLDIKALAAIYAKSGVDIFDITADEHALEALFDGILSQNLNPNDFSICTSFSFSDDIHGSKAKIDDLKCTKCKKCKEICPYGAINENCEIIYEKCIGCRKCSFCNAISYIKKAQNPVETLKSLQKFDINMVELHVNGLTKNEILSEIKKIKEVFPKIKIGICLTYQKYPIEEIKEIIEEASELVKPQELLFQADGKSMSGITEDLYSAKSAVDFAKELNNIIKDKNIKIILSGGCNSKTFELVRQEKAKISGIAYGSFARILASPYVKNSEFWYNIDVINQAIEKCSCLNVKHS